MTIRLHQCEAQDRQDRAFYACIIKMISWIVPSASQPLTQRAFFLQLLSIVSYTGLVRVLACYTLQVQSLPTLSPKKMTVPHNAAVFSISSDRHTLWNGCRCELKKKTTYIALTLTFLVHLMKTWLIIYIQSLDRITNMTEWLKTIAKTILVIE